MVSGYFDGLHSGHTRFFQEASHYGRVLVAMGCDERLRKVKNTEPIYPELERLYMALSCKYVEDAFIMPEVDSEGGAVWERYLDIYKPFYFIANDDLSPEWENIQREICEKHNVRFLKLKRTPAPFLNERSSSELRSKLMENNNDTL